MNHDQRAFLWGCLVLAGYIWGYVALLCFAVFALFPDVAQRSPPLFVGAVLATFVIVAVGTFAEWGHDLWRRHVHPPTAASRPKGGRTIG